jgi:hypothetical protein
MRTLVLIIAICNFAISVNAQKDTTYGYLSRYNYKSTQDEAMYYTKLYTVNNLWHKQKFLIKDDHLVDETDYLDKDCKINHGFYREYTDSGKLCAEFFLQNDRTTYGTYFHANGTKAGYAEYDTAQRIATKQQGWDENGVAIMNYVFYRSAEFPGKSQGWIRFLQKNLKSNVPANNGARIGRYRVELGFYVETDGSLSDISILEDPGFGTGYEALRVMRLSKDWVPGIENNKPKRILFRQPIIFQVSD